MSRKELAQPIFSLNPTLKSPLRQKLFNLVRRPLERLLSLDGINDVYTSAVRLGAGRPFLDRLLEVLHLRYQLGKDDYARIPASGPLVVVANHPFGGAEGVLIAHLLRSIRPDVKVMVNYLLERIPELREHFIFVDPFGGEAAARANVKGMKRSIEWVQSGGALVVFPAGAVSHLHVHKRCITDPPWSPTIARIVRKTGAPVVPIFFDGANGPLFHLLGLVHPRLRTAMLPRQLLDKRDKCIEVRVGSAISPASLRSFENERQMTAYLRLRTYMLQNRLKKDGPPRRRIAPAPASLRPIVAPLDAALLSSEVDRLPPGQTLSENSGYRVCFARAEQIPQVLQEIGRLREVTFRAAGEGTGKPLDLDEFDAHYVHLFLWNIAARQVVGAYRMAHVDEVLRCHGIEGLYTSTLFRYKLQLLDQIGPALELGRSFVRSEYQRSYMPLMLLWKGIGQYVIRHPRYKTLFGAVSITNEYHNVSRSLMVTFLKLHSFSQELARLVKARSPFREQLVKGLDLDPQATCAIVRDIDDVSSLISDIESDRKGIPILLKQYLRLGGKTLAFNIDAEFSDVLDGLLVADLTQCDRRVLSRYMGAREVEEFWAYHASAKAARV